MKYLVVSNEDGIAVKVLKDGEAAPNASDYDGEIVVCKNIQEAQAAFLKLFNHELADAFSKLEKKKEAFFWSDHYMMGECVQAVEDDHYMFSIGNGEEEEE